MTIAYITNSFICIISEYDTQFWMISLSLFGVLGVFSIWLSIMWSDSKFLGILRWRFCNNIDIRIIFYMKWNSNINSKTNKQTHTRTTKHFTFQWTWSVALNDVRSHVFGFFSFHYFFFFFFIFFCFIWPFQALSVCVNDFFFQKKYKFNVLFIFKYKMKAKKNYSKSLHGLQNQRQKHLFFSKPI